ncbi:recombinase family protein [Elstera cyanobacteriorum]|uniref:recombinase family protein n=1 Tax=Elstera cyanobacteriorum TaxID=2022747 RepID=UPI002356B387|nr:recombinase family protein [Elstera cyanobacteriorum]MCK6444071.1 recombinase family protein [Elstera cyanobacteriorum]
MHTFVYARVSTHTQHIDNQILEIDQAGILADAIYTETVSGSVLALDRPEFARMLDAIERTWKPKRLVVNKLDRLGRDASDVMQTVKRLDVAGCSVKVLQLGDIDLTSPPGKLVLATLAAVAEIERDILIERTQAGLQRAKAEGKRLGRPRTASWDSAAVIRTALAEGASVSQVARDHNVSRATAIRIRDRATAS